MFYIHIAPEHEMACLLEVFGEIADGVLARFGGNLEDVRKALEENYSGCYSCLADCAEELTTETSEMPEHFARITWVSRSKLF